MITRELAGYAVADSATGLAGFDFKALTATARPAGEGKRLAAAVFVMVPDDASTVVAGYYTLSATSVAKALRLPRSWG